MSASAPRLLRIEPSPMFKPDPRWCETAGRAGRRTTCIPTSWSRHATPGRVLAPSLVCPHSAAPDPSPAFNRPGPDPAALAPLSRDLTRWANDPVFLPGGHLLGTSCRRICDTPYPRRVLRIRPGLEPRWEEHRLRVRPLWQLRRVRHAGRRRRSDPTHLPLGWGDPNHLYRG